MLVRSHRDLKVWQAAVDLVADVYTIGHKLPVTERYGLTLQLQHSVVSIPANIAEGHGRRHLGEYLHHLSIAAGSLAEVRTLLVIARRLEYITEHDRSSVEARAEEISKMLAGLTKKLRGRSGDSCRVSGARWKVRE